VPRHNRHTPDTVDCINRGMVIWLPREEVAGPVASMRVASPERWWRAATAPLVAGLTGWFLSGSLRLGHMPGNPPRGLPPLAQIIVTCLAVAVGLCLAVLIMRTHLTVGDEGLALFWVFRDVAGPGHSLVNVIDPAALPSGAGLAIEVDDSKQQLFFSFQIGLVRVSPGCTGS
jgi:hypothetical protein